MPETWKGACEEMDDAARKKAIEEFTLDGLHILLAEDNDVNAEIAMEIMEMEGAVLERACDGIEAVRMFEENPENGYDAILMDIHYREVRRMMGEALLKRGESEV